jgi:hypothetical protein
MNNKYLPYLILFCALGLGVSAAYYSIVGLSMLFAGVALPVTIMASFLEISKLSIATLLHRSWKTLNGLLKTYLTAAVVVLSLITSAGIYGLLSSGYQTTANKSDVVDQRINSLESKKQSYELIKTGYLTDKESLTKSTSELRTALSKNTVLQSVDKKGNLITRESKGNRKVFENQLSSSIKAEEVLSTKLDIINDSIFNLEAQILNIKAGNDLANELGPLKYLSSLTGQPMDKVINWFMIIIILVFDPLAIALVIAANASFEKNRVPKEYLIYEPNPKEVEPESIELPLVLPTQEEIMEQYDTNGDGVLSEEEISKIPPELQQMKTLLQRPDISGWRKNRIKEQLPPDDNVKEY